jgi:preprotein translocase subunit SecB
MLAQLQLERYRLDDLHVEFNQEWFEAGQPEESLLWYDMDLDVQFYTKSDDENIRLVQLSIACKPQQEHAAECRFDRIAVGLVGVFRVAEETSEELRDVLLDLNSVSILHGIARGLIVSATGSCAGGTFILPAVNYQETLSQGALEEEQESEDSAAPEALPSGESENKTPVP